MKSWRLVSKLSQYLFLPVVPIALFELDKHRATLLTKYTRTRTTANYSLEQALNANSYTAFLLIQLGVRELLLNSVLKKKNIVDVLLLYLSIKLYPNATEDKSSNAGRCSFTPAIAL